MSNFFYKIFFEKFVWDIEKKYFTGKRTGVALSHVRNNLLYKRGIPPVVLLLSDGRSGDHVFEISRQLREEGAQVSFSFSLKVINKIENN